jgi:uncharacterized membrane protein
VIASLPRRRWDLLLVWVLVLAYVLCFSALSIRQNDAFRTTVHDLGVMDQAAWNTLHGRFVMESSQEGAPLSRLRGHVEPAFLLISFVYAVYDSVNALLILQAVVISLGAFPVFWLARDVLAGDGASQRMAAWAGVAAATAYLLFPALEAANLTEFHPVALTPTLFLCAFYYLQKAGYRRYGLFALLAMACKEDMALIVAMLGLYLLVRGPRVGRARWNAPESRPRLWWGAGSVAVGILWFFLCIYVIVPRFSASGTYGLMQRYAELGGSLSGILATLLTRPQVVAQLLLAPERLSYLAGLLTSVGFLSLFSPLTLAIAGPSLAVNLLSNYPVMYSGVSHYAAPVVPWVIVSAVYGLSLLRVRLGITLQRLGSRWRSLVGGVLVGWLVVSALGYHAAYGYSPLGGRWQVAEVTAHDRLAERFVRQIPPAARLSVQPALFPHASHREYIYEFPIVADAEYVWLDVTSSVGMHPNDFRALFDKLLNGGGFRIVDAADGYILLAKGNVGQRELPDAFYTFARAPEARPQYPVVLDYGGSLRLLGFDLYEVTEDAQAWTGLRLYWQALRPLPAGLRQYPFFFDDVGTVTENTDQRPVVTAQWYPPEKWGVGETVVMEKLPWPLGQGSNLGLGVVQAGDWSRADQRLAITQALPGGTGGAGGLVPLADGGTWAYLASTSRVDGELVAHLARRQFAAPAMQHLAGLNLGNQVTLLGYDQSVQGRRVALTLYWQASSLMPVSYTVFVHLLDAQGKQWAQSDGLPAAGAQLTNGWQVGEVVADRRAVVLPADAPAGVYRLEVGMYRLDTMQRLPALDAAGSPVPDDLSVGTFDLRP